MASICFDDDHMVFMSGRALRGLMEFTMERTEDDGFKEHLFDCANWGNVELQDLQPEHLALLRHCCAEYIVVLEGNGSAREEYIAPFRDALLLIQQKFGGA